MRQGSESPPPGAPADQPLTLLYRFDGPARFAVMRSETTAPGSVTLEPGRRGGESHLRIRYRREAEPDSENGGEPACDHELPAAIAIALPLVAIDGEPRQFLLDVLGDASGCHLAVDACDANGRRLDYSFGAIGFFGWRTCLAEVGGPVECPTRQGSEKALRARLPIQLFRLRLTLPAGSDVVDLGIASLLVTGNVRPVPPGLANQLA